MWALFRGELDTHAAALNQGLLALEQDPSALDQVKPLMRAAHSIKGAARVIQHGLAVEVAHAMEDRLVAAQDGARPLSPDDLQRLLEAVDFLERISPEDETERETHVEAARADGAALVSALRQSPGPPGAPAAPAPSTPPAPIPALAPEPTSAPEPTTAAPAADRSIRLTAQTVTPLVGLVSDAVVSTRWLEPFAASLVRLKAQLADITRAVDRLEIDHWVWYRVGSRDETPGRTGNSHWTEHMLFKGTPRFPAGILDRAVAREGGSWNAFTYLDWTTYYEVMPAEKIHLALELEADRMANSLFSEADVESERTVIISERQGSENEPTFLLAEEVQAAAFRVHSYHHDIIGDMADLQSMQRADLYKHYGNFYLPNNAVLAVAGDFETDQMVGKIRNLYEGIAHGAVPARLSRPEPPQPGDPASAFSCP